MTTIKLSLPAMAPKKSFSCKKSIGLILFFCGLNANGTIPEYNCPGGCLGLDLSLENATEATDSADYELTSSERSIVEVFEITNLTSLRFATPCETPNHEPMLCVEITQCPVLSAVVKKKKYAAFVEASRCGPPNESQTNFKVCCGKYNSFRNVSSQIDTNDDSVNERDTNLLPKKCGTQRQIMRGRIVGGTEAALGEYPWLARIIHKNDYGYKTYGCSGFLIHVKFVLTAAHCIESEFSRVRGQPYSVVLGEHNIETKIDCSPGGTYCAEAPQISRINKIIVHSEYSNKSKNHHNDVALILLNKAVKLSEYVQPICLLTNANEQVKKYWISGWGKTESRESSPIKLKVDIMPFDIEECKSKFQMLNLEINESQICAGGAKLKDSCNGDSGGPLMMSPNGTQFFAAGLVSYGIGCGMEGWPGVYTSIPTYVNWINSEILKMSISNRSTKVKKHNKKNKNKQKVKDQVPTTQNIINS